jgi:hypothetical protein
MTQARQPTRREMLQQTAVSVAGLLGGQIGFAEQQRDLIRHENEKPGSTSWLLENTRVDPPTKYRCPWIEGYVSHTSIRAGEKLSIFVSTNPPSPFVIDIYRLGYYGGKGGRHLLQLGPFQGKVQPDPEVGVERLRECQWEPCTTLTIPNDWPSGVYLGKLTAEREKLQSYIIFIVRDDRRCDFLFQCSDTTWCAYNRWPSQWSLYDDGKKVWYWGPNVRVSWDRPYGKYCQIFDAPCRRVPASFCSGNSRWRSGWRRRGTTFPISATPTLTAIPPACFVPRRFYPWATMNTGRWKCSATSKPPSRRG